MNRACLWVVLSILPMLSLAHDTTHVHPLITDKIRELLANQDADGRYQELHYEVSNPDDPGNPLYPHWGNDWDTANPPERVSDVMDDNFPPYAGYATVMAGVVQEDAPVWKVRHHFHHALHGTGLKFIGTSTYLGGPSAARAMAFFREAVDLYGLYADAARSAAMFHFGMALHHVEDMSSPAHVHNDPHLTFLAPERDDYEGYYLPYQRLPESLPGVTGLSFAGATAVTPVDDPVRDIWGVDNPQSLVRLTHARTTYQATLGYPGSKVTVNECG